MRNSKPRILFVHPDLRGGGAEKVLVNLLNSLDPNAYELHLSTCFKEGIHRKNLHPSIGQHYLFNKVFRGWAQLQKLLSPSQLYRWVVKKQYDLIVAYLEGVPVRIVSGCPYPKTKLVAWIHTDFNKHKINQVFRSKKEMKQAYARFDQIIGVSEKVVQSFKEALPNISTVPKVIHNTLDIGHILKGSKEPIATFDQAYFHLCSVGRLTALKGYDRLIKVFAEVLKIYPHMRLHLLGMGEEQQALEQLVEQLNIKEKVSFLGFQKNPYPYIAQSDLFVCSSYHEGYSTAVTEAILLATPVLTTDCAGMEEILDYGKAGMIVPNSSEGLQQGLLQLLSQPKLLQSYRREAQKRAIHYQSLNNTKEVEQLINALLN